MVNEGKNIGHGKIKWRITEHGKMKLRITGHSKMKGTITGHGKMKGTITGHGEIKWRITKQYKYEIRILVFLIFFICNFSNLQLIFFSYSEKFLIHSCYITMCM